MNKLTIPKHRVPDVGVELRTICYAISNDVSQLQYVKVTAISEIYHFEKFLDFCSAYLMYQTFSSNVGCIKIVLSIDLFKNLYIFHFCLI